MKNHYQYWSNFVQVGDEDPMSKAIGDHATVLTQVIPAQFQ